MIIIISIIIIIIIIISMIIRFGTCGGCEEVIEIMRKHGSTTHAVTDYGMYALAHLAYFNLENKHKLSHVETYKLIMDLLKLHGCEHISITSFGLTAVSNLIHTDASKDRFGLLGMCELVYLPGSHHQMKPEALANNVIFTIGKLTHKHSVNGGALVRLGGEKLVLQALQFYGVEKVSLSGNGLFALGALIQSSPSVVSQLGNSEFADTILLLMCAHGHTDPSVAVYGVNVLESVASHSVILLEYLLSKPVASLLFLQMLKVYVVGPFNCNNEIACRTINLLNMLVKLNPQKVSEYYKTLDFDVKLFLKKSFLLNPILMDKQANTQATFIIEQLKENE